MEKLTKELAEKLMQTKGETRGFNLEHDARWILKEKGEKGLKKVEEKLKQLGYPIKYKELRIMGFYPAGLRGISLLTTREVFNLGEAGVKKVCAFHPKVSLVVRLFMKHFASIPQVMKAAPKMWKKYWTVGELIAVNYDLMEKYCILRVKDFDLHPVFCGCCMEGYLMTLAEMVLRNKKVKCKETKCTFKGDEYHEYLIKWE